MIESIMTKLSSYQIASSFIPGAVLVTALSWAGIVPARSLGTSETVLLYYISGLVMNRIGAVSALWFDKKRLERLYRMYEEKEQARNVYDSYVLYRTLAVAMILLLAVSVAHILPADPAPRAIIEPPVAAFAHWRGLAWLTGLGGIVFAAATVLQLRYLGLIEDGMFPQERRVVDAANVAANQAPAL